MIRTVTIKQNRGEGRLIVGYSLAMDEKPTGESTTWVQYSELDFGVAQAIEDFLATGEVSDYNNY